MTSARWVVSAGSENRPISASVCTISGVRRARIRAIQAPSRSVMRLNQPERENEERSYARQFSLHCTDELAKGATGEERIAGELRERNEWLCY